MIPRIRTFESSRQFSREKHISQFTLAVSCHSRVISVEVDVFKIDWTSLTKIYIYFFWRTQFLTYFWNLLVCANDDTLMMRAGAEFRILGNRSEVNKKCPKWLTPNWVSKPSWVFPLGQAITPAINSIRV